MSAIIFGAINLSVDKLALAQNSDSENTSKNTASSPSVDLLDAILVPLLSQIAPIVGGFVTIGIQFARKHGLKISADAEEYFVNSAKSFVDNQSRFLYKQIKTNPEYAVSFAQGRIPKDLGKEALAEVKRQLEVELQSDEFTKTARQMLKDNLDTLVERAVTQNNKELAEKGRDLLNDLIPVAVNAALLAFKTPDEAQKEKDKIIEDVLKTVEKNFDYENLLFSNDVAVMHIKSELNKKIGSIK